MFQPGSRIQQVFDKCCGGITDSALDEFCQGIGVNKLWALYNIGKGEKRGWSDPPRYRKRTNRLGYTWRYEHMNGIHRITDAVEMP